jgi:glucose-1-phosphate thymidylyltransferase
MKAIILAAGYATRLYPLTRNRPKALLPIQKKPIIDFIIDELYSLTDINEIIIVSNDKFSPLFNNWLKERQFRERIKVINDRTSSEKDRLGAVGDLDFVIKTEHINSDILVIAGDNIFNFNLTDFIQSSLKISHVSIGVYDIGDLEESKKFGVVKIGENSYITDFQEKPQTPSSNLIAVGIYFLPVVTLKFIDEYLNTQNSHDVLGHYIRWLLTRDGVRGHKFSGTWYDIGDIASYKKANRDFASLNYKSTNPAFLI